MNSKSTVTLKKLVMAALFAALACVATMSIKIPTPGTNAGARAFAGPSRSSSTRSLG